MMPSRATMKPRIRSGLSRPRPLHGAPRRSLLTPGRLTAPRPVPRTSLPIHDSSDDAAELLYFAVLYTKRSKKKRKSWLDGYILIKNDRHVELQNENGKRVAAERCKPLGGMKEGNTLEIGNWELEVQHSVEEDDYISGRLFMKPSIQSVSTLGIASKAIIGAKRTPFKPLRPRNASASTSKTTGPVGPMHDPNAPNACVLLPAVKGALNGNDSFPIVLDPFLGKRMRPHQLEGVKFLYNCVQGSFFLTGESGQGAILADEMGLGKSLQAIAMIWTVLKQHPRGHSTVKKAAIVCPASLVQNWVNEVKKWLGDERLEPVAVASGNSTFESKEALAAFINGSVRRLLIISYEMFRSYAEQMYKSKIGLLVCDEGHRLKSSHGNKTIEALKRLPCPSRIILTGTPVQNDLEEFFAVCDFVNPGCLNSLVSFRTVFANPIIASRDSNARPSTVKIGESRAKELSRITSKFVLRRTSGILAKYLPPKHEVAIFCRLQQRQESAYEKEARNRFADMSSMRRFSAALSAINYLRKICCHPDLLGDGSQNMDDDIGFSDEEEELPDVKTLLKKFQVEDSSKIQITLSICKASLSVKDRVILVSNYTSTLDFLQEALNREKIEHCRLDGSTAVGHRGDIVRRFNCGSLGDVFLLSAKAGGVGLNLIGANRLILFDPDWNPATDLQAMARIWRDGQKKHVYVYRLLCTGTIEEKIFQRQLFKGELQSAVDGGHARDKKENIQNGESAATIMGTKEGNFSAEELRDLFQYNPNLKFCDTLEVLERSQEENTSNRDRRPSSTLLNGFKEYAHIFQKKRGIVGEVFCGEDMVLEKALNVDINSQGIVSYLYTKKTESRAAAADNRASGTGLCSISKDATAQQGNLSAGEFSSGVKQRVKVQPPFDSDVENEKCSSEEDEDIHILLAMERNERRQKARNNTEQPQIRHKRKQSVLQTAPQSKKMRESSGSRENMVPEAVSTEQKDQEWDEAIREMENGLSDDFENE